MISFLAFFGFRLLLPCRIAAVRLFCCLPLYLAFLVIAAQAEPPRPAVAPQPKASDQLGQRQAFVVGGITNEKLITLTAMLAGGPQPTVILFDTPSSTEYVKAFLAKFKPVRVVPVGTFPNGIADLEQRLGIKTAPSIEWKRGPPNALWKEQYPEAEQIVVCPDQPRSLLLQAACLAGSLQVPLFVMPAGPEALPELKSWLASWKPRDVLVCGSAMATLKNSKLNVGIIELADEAAVAAAYLKKQLARGPVNNLVVANPFDDQKGKGNMSLLAPWVALERRALLLLTNQAGDNVAEIVQNALQNPHIRRADSLILVANLKAIPMLQRPNPVPGKDKFIDMEPLTPTASEPFSFATGRLFHADRGVVALILARRHLHEEIATAKEKPVRKALVVSNPGGGLPLLELFSRNTAREFRNTGYQTTALFHKEVNKDEVRRLLPEHDIFLWEGHHKTLVKDYGLPKWTELLPPSLIFLQSCLALNEEEASPLLARGSIAVVGSSTRTYSASGGAMSLAFFNALLYEDQTLGGSLRQAKNFLLCYTLLKERRLADKAKLTGANQRAAWAFTLWGDPTLRLPRPVPPADALPHVQHRVQGKSIILLLPAKPYDRYVTDSFQSELWPNARMAGLLASAGDEGARRFVPFLFAEVALPDVPDGKRPTLCGELPSSHWVFCWDSRRKVGYLLARPRARDQGELRFQVHFEK